MCINITLPDSGVRIVRNFDHVTIEAATGPWEMGQGQMVGMGQRSW